MAFPLFIAALVLIRTKFLPRYFDAATLNVIDPLIDLGDGMGRRAASRLCLGARRVMS